MKKKKVEALKSILKSVKAVASTASLTTESDPKKAMETVLRNKMRELKKEFDSTNDGRKVLEEYPLTQALIKLYKTVEEQRILTERAVHKMKHMSEGFWSQVREEYDLYGNNLHLDEKKNVIQVTEESEEEE